MPPTVPDPAELLAQFRFFLKDTIRKQFDFAQTDQHKGLAPPPVQKPAAADARRIDLVPAEELASLGAQDLFSAIKNRKSRRNYQPEPLSLAQLSFLLWATQGIRQKIDQAHALRTVPSAGCRHALETYLCIFAVQDIPPGIYRYLPLEHQLVFESAPERLSKRLTEGVFGQPFAGRSAVTFIWTAIPYRMEWRYGLAAHKVIALDAGHVCQNLYLGCEAIGAGTCAMAAYDQQAMDALLDIDGEEEFVIYLAAVGPKPAHG